MADGFKSHAQRDHWKTLVTAGKVTQAQYDARDQATPADVPTRAAPRTRTVGPSRAPDAAKIGNTRY